jgi:hydrogenase maturation protein HypF
MGLETRYITDDRWDSGPQPVAAQANVFEVSIVAGAPVLALGAELKNTVCLLEGRRATMSEPFGALSDATAYRLFLGHVEAVRNRVEGRDLVLAHDLHPAFLTTEYARKNGKRTIPVQHHHAHVVACMSENGVAEPVIGLSCDGTGYGTDGTIWGCEVLRATLSDFHRAGHLSYFTLPGGDAAARETWRPALSLVRQSYGDNLPDRVRALFETVPARSTAAVEGMLSRGFNCPHTSSLGRLFDAVAFLTRLCEHNDQEGQAAMRLESAAASARDAGPYPHQLIDRDGIRQLDASAVIHAVCEDTLAGTPAATVARRFHETVASGLAEMVLPECERTGIHSVAITGGCFTNQILTSRVHALLSAGGVERVLSHEATPCGDAGVSLGQAVAAAAMLERKR